MREHVDYRDFYSGIRGKRVSFIGAGVSHKELILQFAAAGAVVTLCDKKQLADLGEYGEKLTALGVRLSLGESYLEGVTLSRDEFFTYQGFLGAKKVVCDDHIIYNYRRRASSVMCSPEAAEQRIRDGLDFVIKRREKVIRRWPELRRAFDESYVDMLWNLSVRPGNTESTMELLKEHLKRYFRTWGNSIPPRYLWPYLWRLHRTDTKTLVERSNARQTDLSGDEYFA